MSALLFYYNRRLNFHNEGELTNAEYKDGIKYNYKMYSRPTTGNLTLARAEHTARSNTYIYIYIHIYTHAYIQ